MTAWRLADAAVVLVLALAALGCSSDESAAPGPPVAPDEWQYFREGVTSPDGKHVVFITPAGEAGGDLKVADRDGNGVRRIYPGESSCCELLT